MYNNKDYKHFVQDFSNLYIGGRNTYQEIMDNDNVPFKLKTIIAHYLLKEVDGDTSLENHVFFIEKDSLSYLVYKKMRAKFLLNVFYEDGHGKDKPGYHIDEFTIDQILEREDLRANMGSIFLTEVRIKKLSLLGVSI